MTPSTNRAEGPGGEASNRARGAILAAGYGIESYGGTLGAAGMTDVHLSFKRGDERHTLRGWDDADLAEKVAEFLSDRGETPSFDAVTIAILRDHLRAAELWNDRLTADLAESRKQAAEAAGSALRDDAIKVWRFHEAPPALRALSAHGGDEDWLALVPPVYAGDWLGWMESGTSFGCCDVSEHPLPDGSVVRIGAHS